MTRIPGQQTAAFLDELRLLKEAGLLSQVGGAIRRGAGAFAKHPFRSGVDLAQSGLAGRYGRQMMLGAGVGGVGGAALDEENRLRGALLGAAGGATLAGGRALATKGGREAAKKSLKRTGYTLTGRGGKSGTPTVEEAKKMGLLKQPARGEFMSRGAASGGLKPTAKEKKKYVKALKQYREESRAFRGGLMTVPGVAHGLATSPLKTLKSGWRRSGMLGKGFAGLGAYETGKGLIETPEPGGPGRAEKALRGAGSTVGWLVAPGGMLAGQAVGGGAGMLAGQVGKGVDVLTRGSPKKAVKSTAGQIPISSRYNPTASHQSFAGKAGEYVR